MEIYKWERKRDVGIHAMRNQIKVHEEVGSARMWSEPGWC